MSLRRGKSRTKTSRCDCAIPQCACVRAEFGRSAQAFRNGNALRLPRCGNRPRFPKIYSRSRWRASARRDRLQTKSNSWNGRRRPSDRFRRSAPVALCRDIRWFACCGLIFEFTLPDRLAFFQKRGDTFLEIGGGADARVFGDGALEIVVDAGGYRGCEEMLGAREAVRASGDEFGREFLSALHEIFGGDNFCDH